MSNEEFMALAGKVADGEASIAELALYNAAYDSFQQEPVSQVSLPVNIDELEKNSLYSLRENFGIAPKKIKLWPRIAVTAAAVAVVVFGVWFFNRTGTGNDGMAYKSDIPPGRNTATLTLADGRVLTLSDAKSGVIVTENALTYNDSSAVIGNTGKDLSLLRDDGKAAGMTLSTPRGGTYQITLTDGTKVWLNAASSLTYSAGLSKQGQPGARVVKLEGEAYFEVAKLFSSPGRAGQRPERVPFIVESAGQKVEVLGTHFNVNAYKDEGAIKTTLLEGKVQVLAVGATKVLHPGEQARNNGQTVNVQKVNTENIIDWKADDFVFNGDDFKTAMRKIERWYNVEVIYEEGISKDIEIGGWISRKNNISSVLKLIESTKQVKFKIDGRRVFVYK